MEIGAPVSTAAMPRDMPSVECMEMQRTSPLPSCWSVSSVYVSPSTFTSTAWKISGMCSADGNRISTTGPVILVMMPFADIAPPTSV